MKRKPNVVVEEGYRTTETAEVLYSGAEVVKVIGCHTGNRFSFLPGKSKIIDIYDAECLDKLPDFKTVKAKVTTNALSSDNRKEVKSGSGDN